MLTGMWPAMQATLKAYASAESLWLADQPSRVKTAYLCRCFPGTETKVVHAALTAAKGSPEHSIQVSAIDLILHSQLAPHILSCNSCQALCAAEDWILVPGLHTAMNMLADAPNSSTIHVQHLPGNHRPGQYNTSAVVIAIHAVPAFTAIASKCLTCSIVTSWETVTAPACSCKTVYAHDAWIGPGTCCIQHPQLGVCFHEKICTNHMHVWCKVYYL